MQRPHAILHPGGEIPCHEHVSVNGSAAQHASFPAPFALGFLFARNLHTQEHLHSAPSCSRGARAWS